MRKGKKLLWILLLLLILVGYRELELTKKPILAFSSNYTWMDRILQNQKYDRSYHVEYKYMYIGFMKHGIIQFQKQAIQHQSTISLSLSKEEILIISLPSNETVAYTWNVKNQSEMPLLSLKHYSWLNVPLPLSEKEKKGASRDRQNFYFEPTETGEQNVLLRYEHKEDLTAHPFEVTLKVIISP